MAEVKNYWLYGRETGQAVGQPAVIGTCVFMTLIWRNGNIPNKIFDVTIATSIGAGCIRLGRTVRSIYVVTASIGRPTRIIILRVVLRILFALQLPSLDCMILH